MEFKQIDGNTDRVASTFTVGSKWFWSTLDGPINEKLLLYSLQEDPICSFYVPRIGLPFLPTYNDFQFKSKTKINDKKIKLQ